MTSKIKRCIISIGWDRKQTGTEIHEYVLDGTNIVKEVVTDAACCPKYTNEYLYDIDGTVCGLKYNGTAYYFYKNLQGDVISIADDTGAVKATYTYDAWGVCEIESDTSGCNIATINPFRYRGYYYDTETDLYYLQSRYYNPEIGRFINADHISMIFIGKNVTMFNEFTYCYNSPITSVDIYGYDAITVLIGIFGTIATYLSWIPIGGKILTIINTVLASAAMAWTIYGYNQDCKMLENSFNRGSITYSTYVDIKQKIDMVFYASVCAYVLGIILGLMGWLGKLLKKVAIQTIATILGVILGFTSTVIAWILDFGYTLQYDSLKQKLGV